MKRLLYLLLLSTPVLFTGCEHDVVLDKAIICSKLAEALFANEQDKRRIEIISLLSSQGKLNGLQESFEELIEQIDSCPNLQVTDSCFGCIQANPPQSEIWVTVTLNNQTVGRAIDLRQNENQLIFLKIHN